MVQVKRILNKKQPTGKELGQVSLADALNYVKSQLDSNFTYDPIDRQLFREKVAELQTPNDRNDYIGYGRIQNWFVRIYYQAISNEQQVYRQLEKMSRIALDAIYDENVYQYIAQLPVIMTEKEYTEFKSNPNRKYNARQLLNGIAILKPIAHSNNKYISERIDANTGYYNPPKVFIDSPTLSQYYPETKDANRNIQSVKEMRTAVLLSYFFVNGYNTIISLIEKLFNLEEFEIGKISPDDMQNKVKTFNNTVATLRDLIHSTDYEDDTLKTKKLGIIDKVFYPIETKGLTPSRQKINKVKKDMLDNYKAFTLDAYSPEMTLCAMTADELRGRLK